MKLLPVPLLVILPCLALAFSDSSAPVTPDPGFTRPEYSSRWPHVSLEEAKRLLGSPGVLFVDGRSFAEWEAGHLPGALAMPTGEFDKRYAMHKARLIKSAVLLCYCHGEGCGLAETLATLLVEKGHRNVAVFAGGYPAWTNAKLPLEDKAGKRVDAAKAKARAKAKKR